MLKKEVLEVLSIYITLGEREGEGAREMGEYVTWERKGKEEETGVLET